MPADALAPSVTIISSSYRTEFWYRQVLVFIDGGFELNLPCEERISHAFAFMLKNKLSMKRVKWFVYKELWKVIYCNVNESAEIIAIQNSTNNFSGDNML